MFNKSVVATAAIALVLSLSQAALTEESPVPLEDLPRIELTESSDDGVTFLFEVDELPMEEIVVNGETYQKVSIPGGGILGEVGQPGIPAFTRLVAIPDDGGCRVRVVSEVEETFDDVHLYPVQEDEGASWAYDLSAYSRAGYGSEPLGKVGDPAIMRDLRVVALTFQPVQYDPAGRRLKVHRRMRVEVEFTGENSTNVKSVHRPVPASFRQLYQDVVLNYQSDRDVEIQNGTYLLIYRDNSTILDKLNPLIEWRRRTGMSVIVASTAETGTSASAIKSYIQGKYNSSDPPLEFVALVGDATGTYAIPTWTETLSGFHGEGDHPYTKLEGDDMLADIHIGRLSFSTFDELERIVTKTVSYESTPYTEDTDWFKRAALVGDPSDSGWSVVHVMQWIKTRLLEMNYTEIDTIWSPGVGNMIPAFNKGDSFIAYRGFWHMSGWTNTNTYQMTNGWKMPFVVTITCDTGSFADGTSITEGFLRAWDTGNDRPRGGVGCIGTATIGTHTRFNNCIFYGIFQGFLYDEQYWTGAALTRGKLEAYLNYGYGNPDWAEITMHWNNLMGDPAVPVWTNVPTQLTVTHPTTIPVGTNAVTVTIHDGVFPVEDAQVCLWKGEETYVVGLTDANGEIELPVDASTPGDMLLTVTKHNRHPYLATIPVENSVVYVGYRSSTIDDDTNGTSLGNGDGMINPGETIELPVSVQNFGLNIANNVTAVLSTSDPYVTILDDTESFGNIPGGGVAWSADDFDFRVDQSCQHAHPIRFSFDVSSDAGDWHSIIDLEVTSADLVAESLTLYGAGGNGILDPGETVEMSVQLRNDGGASALATTGTLSIQSPYITIDDGTGYFGNIGVGGTGDNSGDRFVITAGSTTYNGYLASFDLVLTFTTGRTDTTHVELVVGNRSTTDPIGPDQYGYLAYDDTDTGYGDAPVYDWVEIDPHYGGDGTEIVLGDYGSYQDKSRVVDLPFQFQYYGEKFEQATVCSNGWLAMGSTYLVNYRNWTIPGAGGPDGMIAAFWDDLYQASGTSNAYQKYDEGNHRWIVEWSRFRNDYNGATETFQIILLDPEFYTSQSGDGEIIFQYDTITNYDPVNGYATVGIESPSNLDGLLYTYWNQYPAGAATLQAGRAIHFVPAIAGPLGVLNGTVTNASAGESPIQGARVTLIDGGRTWTTDADGNYGGLAPVGTYDVAVGHISFEPDTARDVVIEEGGEVDLDFSLEDILGPILTTSQHPDTDDETGPYLITVTIEEYSGVEEALLYYRAGSGGPFLPLPLDPLGDDEYSAEIPGQPYVTQVQYYSYARDIVGLETTDPPDAPNEYYSFFVAPTITVFTDDMETDKGWTVGAPDDDATTGIWERVDPNGTLSGSDEVQPEDDHTPDPGVMCFVTGNAPPGSGQGDDDVDDGKTTLTSPILDLSVSGSFTLKYYRWYTNDTGNAPGQDFWVALISSDGGNNWTTLENTNLSERYWKPMEFAVEDYITPTNQVQLRFVASDEGDGSIVEAAVDDLDLFYTGVSGASDELVSAPVFLLFQNMPNPAASNTTIRFALDRSGRAELGVFDVQGRLVRSLIKGRMPAGVHTIVWDGLDGQGHSAPSGVYFYKLEAGEKVLTKKMMLMK